MTNRDRWFRIVVRMSVVTLALVLPTVALAHFCGAGRMTGGGKLVTLDTRNGTVVLTNGYVTNGYELHCGEFDLPNNLEINGHDPNGSRFKLDYLTSINCFTDPNFTSKQPAAGFNTYAGVGNGTWSSGNTSIPACVEFVFVDGQGPTPQNNFSYIQVTDVPATRENPATNLCTATDIGPPPIPIGQGKLCTGNVLLTVPYQTPLSGQNQAHK